MLEQLDRDIIGPLAQYLERTHPDDWRMMVLPDHYTLSHDGTHHPRPVPVLVVGAGVMPTNQSRYTEAAAEGTPIVIGQRLMDPFLSEMPFVWNADFARRANCGEEAMDGELEDPAIRVAGGMRG
jgi:2,3-bisphosphoglycerate-independent phosphoglycerate mutase